MSDQAKPAFVDAADSAASEREQADSFVNGQQKTCGTCANGEPSIYCDLYSRHFEPSHECNNPGERYRPRTDTRDFDALAEVAGYMLGYIRDMNNPYRTTHYDATEYFEGRLADCGVEV